jgi:hypothetical protein
MMAGLLAYVRALLPGSLFDTGRWTVEAHDCQFPTRALQLNRQHAAVFL